MLKTFENMSMVMGAIGLLVWFSSSCQPVAGPCESRDLACAKETLRLERDGIACREVSAANKMQINDLKQELKHMKHKWWDSAHECMKLCGAFAVVDVPNGDEMYQGCKRQCRYEAPKGAEED